MCVSGHHFDACFIRRIDHFRALFDGQCQRLLHDHVLAVVSRHEGMLMVQLGWCGDVNHLDVGVGAKVFYIRICSTAELIGEAGQRLRPGVGRGHHPIRQRRHVGVLLKNPCYCLADSEKS